MGVQIRRRGFFRLVAGGFAWFASGATEGENLALEVHRATRNTRLGALGVRRPRLRGLPRPYKSYPRAQRQALPAPGDEQGLSLAEAVRGFAPAPGFRAEPVLLARLARVLHLTNGVTGRAPRGGRALRAAPSAGALYAGEVYVVAERVEGLAPGVYYYSVREHALLRLEKGARLAEAAGCLERPASLQGAAACVVLTNVFARYTWRYANRGYRYALIDSGHIGENLRLAAHSAGLAERSWLRFLDDRLGALLGVAGTGEAVCALHALGAPASEGPAQDELAVALGEKGQADHPGRATVPERYHEATKLVPASSKAPPSSKGGGAAADKGGARKALARAASAPATSVEESIRVRRSARRFESGPVARSQLDFVLEATQRNPGLERSPDVALYLVAHCVSGLDAGLYRYAAQAGRLSPLRSGDLRERLVDACLGQEKAGSAAVAFVMVGGLERARARAGDRSYRDLLLEAGGVGQRIYLAAEALGLAARNLAAYRDDDLNELLGVDGRRWAALHLTMLGPGY